MPIFVSYSHADKDFAERLAAQLVVNKVHIWIDQWEIHVGDSLLTKVQEAITGASALLVVLSKASVKSEWCKKELNSGLIRELEEKRVVVLPVLKENCDVPMFLREKLYADFRTNFDDGLRTILEAVAKVTNEWQGRLESRDHHTDWAIDWGTTNDGLHIFRLTMIDLPKDQPYTVLGILSIIMDKDASDWYAKQIGLGHDEMTRREIIWALADKIRDSDEFTFWFDDRFEQTKFITFDVAEVTFGAIVGARRLGMDTGRPIIFRFGGQLDNVAKNMREITKQEAEASAKTKLALRKKGRKQSPKSPTKKSKSRRKN